MLESHRHAEPQAWIEIVTESWVPANPAWLPLIFLIVHLTGTVGAVCKAALASRIASSSASFTSFLRDIPVNVFTGRSCLFALNNTITNDTIRSNDSCDGNHRSCFLWRQQLNSRLSQSSRLANVGTITAEGDRKVAQRTASRSSGCASAIHIVRPPLSSLGGPTISATIIKILKRLSHF